MLPDCRTETHELLFVLAGHLCILRNYRSAIADGAEYDGLMTGVAFVAAAFTSNALLIHLFSSSSVFESPF